MNETIMFDMGITNEDIHYILKTTYGSNVLCFYSDYNTDDKVVFRIRPQNIAPKKKTDTGGARVGWEAHPARRTRPDPRKGAR